MDASADGPIMTVTIMVRRPNPGISLAERATAIMAGANGATLTHDQFRDLYGATDDDLDAIQRFAADRGLTVVNAYHRGANVVLEGTMDQIGAAFGVVLTKDASGIAASGPPVIPPELDGIIDAVMGLDTRTRLRPMLKGLDPALVPAGMSLHLTPTQVATAYQFPAGDGLGSTIGILEFGGGYTNQNLASSFGAVGQAVPTVVDVLVTGGTNDPTDLGGSEEVMLDIFVAAGVAPGARLAIYFAPNSLASFVNAMNAAIHDATNAPSVISISWGLGEVYWGGLIPVLDSVFQAAAVRGITVCVASGDHGSESDLGEPPFTVGYPASSPHVLACGGTTLQLNANGLRTHEVVWNQGSAGSGGGVSSIQSVPPYQEGLTTTQHPSGTVRALSGRGVPDVAGNGDPATGYRFYHGAANTLTQTAGTSAVAPLWAGLIARLNQLTGRRLGFANAMLYANTGVLTDITSGNNADPAAVGYASVSGWDACTGLGSPIGVGLYGLVRTGGAWPRLNRGFRTASGMVYPRLDQGAR